MALAPPARAYYDIGIVSIGWSFARLRKQIARSETTNAGPVRPVDLEILAVMIGIAFGTAIDDQEAAAHMGVDVATDDLALGRREKKMGRLLRV